jgi:hypothetical protein
MLGDNSDVHVVKNIVNYCMHEHDNDEISFRHVMSNPLFHFFTFYHSIKHLFRILNLLLKKNHKLPNVGPF